MHPVAFAIALALIGFLHVVLGEMVPKNIALAGPDRAALALAPPLAMVVRVLRPAIALLNWIANRDAARRRRRAARRGHERVHARRGRRASSRESRREGMLDAGEERLLIGALEFEERDVRSVLLPLDRRSRPSPPDVTPAQVEALAARTGYSRFPVARATATLVGYLHLKDALEIEDRHRNRPIAPLLDPAAGRRRARPTGCATVLRDDAALQRAPRARAGRRRRRARRRRARGRARGARRRDPRRVAAARGIGLRAAQVTIAYDGSDGASRAIEAAAQLFPSAAAKAWSGARPDARGRPPRSRSRRPWPGSWRSPGRRRRTRRRGRQAARAAGLAAEGMVAAAARSRPGPGCWTPPPAPTCSCAGAAAAAGWPARCSARRRASLLHHSPVPLLIVPDARRPDGPAVHGLRRLRGRGHAIAVAGHVARRAAGGRHPRLGVAVPAFPERPRDVPRPELRRAGRGSRGLARRRRRRGHGARRRAWPASPAWTRAARPRLRRGRLARDLRRGAGDAAVIVSGARGHRRARGRRCWVGVRGLGHNAERPVLIVPPAACRPTRVRRRHPPAPSFAAMESPTRRCRSASPSARPAHAARRSERSGRTRAAVARHADLDPAGRGPGLRAGPRGRQPRAPRLEARRARWPSSPAVRGLRSCSWS